MANVVFVFRPHCQLYYVVDTTSAMNEDKFFEYLKLDLKTLYRWKKCKLLSLEKLAALTVAASVSDCGKVPAQTRVTKLKLPTALQETVFNLVLMNKREYDDFWYYFSYGIKFKVQSEKDKANEITEFYDYYVDL